MDEPKCPFCNIIQKKSIKNWKYGSVEVDRYKCNCGKFFNFYKGEITNWTIPKGKT